jgi:hypothetical protein
MPVPKPRFGPFNACVCFLFANQHISSLDNWICVLLKNHGRWDDKLASQVVPGYRRESTWSNLSLAPSYSLYSILYQSDIAKTKWVLLMICPKLVFVDSMSRRVSSCLHCPSVSLTLRSQKRWPSFTCAKTLQRYNAISTFWKRHYFLTQKKRSRRTLYNWDEIIHEIM